MPGGDGTGPGGMGPMTGRAAGYCAGYPMPGYMNPVPGRGFGMGYGWGHGWGRGYGAVPMTGAYPYAPGYAPLQMTPENEKAALKAQAESLKNVLGTIEERLSALEKEE